MTTTTCPSAGSGVHSWLLGEANRCRTAGLTADATERLLASAITRPPKPATEIVTTVAKAYSGTWTPSSRPAPCRAHHRPTVPLTAVVFDPAKLQAVASTIAQPKNWRHWLWERSPKRPEAQNAYSFLKCLYRPGENVLVFDQMDAKTPVETVTIADPQDCRVPATLRGGGRGCVCIRRLPGGSRRRGRRPGDAGGRVGCFGRLATLFVYPVRRGGRNARSSPGATRARIPTRDAPASPRRTTRDALYVVSPTLPTRANAGAKKHPHPPPVHSRAPTT